VMRVPKSKRYRFQAEYKLRIAREPHRCKAPGNVGGPALPGGE